MPPVRARAAAAARSAGMPSVPARSLPVPSGTTPRAHSLPARPCAAWCMVPSPPATTSRATPSATARRACAAMWTPLSLTASPPPAAEASTRSRSRRAAAPHRPAAGLSRKRTGPAAASEVPASRGSSFGQERQSRSYHSPSGVLLRTAAVRTRLLRAGSPKCPMVVLEGRRAPGRRTLPGRPLGEAPQSSAPSSKTLAQREAGERSAAPKPCCSLRGSLAVYHRFKDRVRELGMRDDVMVTRTGCLKHCSRGITVAVWPYNLWYSGVTIADVDEILTSTVAGGGKEVERLRMPDIPWE